MQNCILTGRTSCSCFQFFGSVSNQINICHQIKANGVDMGFLLNHVVHVLSGLLFIKIYDFNDLTIFSVCLHCTRVCVEHVNKQLTLTKGSRLANNLEQNLGFDSLKLNNWMKNFLNLLFVTKSRQMVLTWGFETCLIFLSDCFVTIFKLICLFTFIVFDEF